MGQYLNANGEPLRDVFVDHDPVDLDCSSMPSMTRQEFRDECDINVLMATYERTHVLSHLNRGTPQYLDVTSVPDLREAMELIAVAEARFMDLPATVRREFDNDPLQFVEYAQDPAHVDRMREWGLAAPAPVPAAPPPSEQPKDPS